MKRVMIIGQPGAGKSWLARALGERTNLPVVHMDKIHWKSGWVERDAAEKMRLTQEVHAREEWIFEGGFSRSWAERATRADTLIWLDFPLWIRAWRVARRTIKDYGHTRPDLPEGCPEQFSLEFWQWIWNTRKTGRLGPTRLFTERPDHLSLFHLKSRSEVGKFLEKIENSIYLKS